MKALTAEWVAKAEGDFATMERESHVRKDPNYDAVCFHAQQCVEKYLKARLYEAGTGFRKVHDLVALLDQVVEIEPLWEPHRLWLSSLTEYAVEFRYPGGRADRETAMNARKYCRFIRQIVRPSLGLDSPTVQKRTSKCLKRR